MNRIATPEKLAELGARVERINQRYAMLHRDVGQCEANAQWIRDARKLLDELNAMLATPPSSVQ